MMVTGPAHAVGSWKPFGSKLVRVAERLKECPR